MEGDAVSGPINVLAVMEDARLCLIGEITSELVVEVAADSLVAAIQAVYELIESADRAMAFMTHEQWGNCDYMDGSEVYRELREQAEDLHCAIANVRLSNHHQQRP